MMIDRPPLVWKKAENEFDSRNFSSFVSALLYNQLPVCYQSVSFWFRNLDEFRYKLAMDDLEVSDPSLFRLVKQNSERVGNYDPAFLPILLELTATHARVVQEVDKLSRQIGELKRFYYFPEENNTND